MNEAWAAQLEIEEHTLVQKQILFRTKNSNCWIRLETKPQTFSISDIYPRFQDSKL